MCLPSTKLNLNDKSDRSHWKIKLTLHDFCFDHNIWWVKFQIFENLCCKGKKTPLKPFPTKLSNTFCCLFLKGEDQQTWQCPQGMSSCQHAAQGSGAAGGVVGAEGVSRPGMLLSLHGRSWAGQPETPGEAASPAHRLQLLRAQTSRGKVSF